MMPGLKQLGLGLAAIAAIIFSAVAVRADVIVRSFNAQGNLQPGWMVALSKTDGATVVLSPGGDSSRIYGVVIDPSLAPLTLQKQNQQVFVATSGNYPVLVSTQNGPIKAGDYLSSSSTDGIAAKATGSNDFVLGKALEGFTGGPQAIVYTNGGSALGRINVQIEPAKNPLQKNAPGVPSSLKHLSESISGKPITVFRLYAALALFLITALIAVITLWGGIRNGMIAIGRNPLSKHSIMKTLAEVILAATLVLIIGLLGVYLLLKL